MKFSFNDPLYCSITQVIMAITCTGGARKGQTLVQGGCKKMLEAGSFCSLSQARLFKKCFFKKKFIVRVKIIHSYVQK